MCLVDAEPIDVLRRAGTVGALSPVPAARSHRPGGQTSTEGFGPHPHEGDAEQRGRRPAVVVELEGVVAVAYSSAVLRWSGERRLLQWSS
jgi:hypothetical protein